MANFKRHRSRKQVRCTLCTPYRWRGNNTSSIGEGRLKRQDQEWNKRAKKEIDAAKKCG